MLASWALLLTGRLGCQAADVFVASTGSDATGDGSITHPYLTIAHAIAAGKVVDGATVQIRGGAYHSAAAPIVNWTHRSEAVTFAAYNGEAVLLSAGLELPASAVQPVTNASVLARLPAVARANVRVVDLAALGISDLGVVAATDDNMLEVFYGGEPMRLARYPNVNSTDPRLWQWSRAVSGTNGTFVYNGDRPTTNDWAAAPDAWIHVYSKFDWSDDIMALKSLNTAHRSITLAGSPGCATAGRVPVLSGC